MGILPDVEAALVAKDETVVRPKFDGGAGGPVKEEDSVDEDEDNNAGKKNFEATSDEDEG